jgi:hypothetical protein
MEIRFGCFDDHEQESMNVVAKELSLSLGISFSFSFSFSQYQGDTGNRLDGSHRLAQMQDSTRSTRTVQLPLCFVDGTSVSFAVWRA